MSRRKRAWSLVVLVFCSVTVGVGLALLVVPRPAVVAPLPVPVSVPVTPDPFPGVSYDGKPYSCAQVGYGSGETSFYRCAPIG